MRFLGLGWGIRRVSRVARLWARLGSVVAVMVTTVLPWVPEAAAQGGVAAATDRSRNGTPPAVKFVAGIADSLPPPRSPVQPQHPVEAKAYVVLETYCARCHQSGQEGARRSAPVSSLANILHLDEIARIPSLVRPGVPDASQLYIRMVQQHLSATTTDDKPVSEPTAPEIEAVRDWIEDVGLRAADERRACEDRPRFTHEDLMSSVQRWLDQVGAEVADDTRFISLAHLQNTCATEVELASYRQAVAKALNSMSWSETRARVETVGDSLSLLSVRLSELGWLEVHWEQLVAAYPLGAANDVPASILAATGTATPIIRADWLASAATRGPLYSTLIGLPATSAELSQLMALELGPVTATRTVPSKRIGVRSSAVTRGQRVLERQANNKTFTWLAYDIATSGEGANAFDQPLGPSTSSPRSVPAKSAFRAESTRILFRLPNGLPGFGMFDADGRRIDRVVSAGVKESRDLAHRINARSTGLGCLRCHGTGLIGAQDEMRAHVESDRFAADRETRDAALKLYPAASEMKTLFDDDRHQYRRALVRAGIDPDHTLHGLEVVTALARQYDLDVGLDRAAAEFGIDRSAFIERLKSYDGPDDMQLLALRQRHGLVSRADAERLYVALRTGRQRKPESAAAATGAPSRSAIGGTPETVSEPEAGSAADLRLSLWSDNATYRSGQLMSVFATPSADCYLTVIGVDSGGKATVLFPNDFDQDNLVRGGRVHRIPALNGPYQLRLRDKGPETLVGICDTTNKAPDGVTHDFERQRFTVLGNWRNFLRNLTDEASEDRRNTDRATASRSRRIVRGRSSEARPDVRYDSETRSDAAVRTATQIIVE
ncbi:MAG: hypothetical protein C0511_11435 [Hyphomicrobium sp.]|nr:hypothetical protein [Hyphomicrobium sp.]